MCRVTHDIPVVLDATAIRTVARSPAASTLSASTTPAAVALAEKEGLPEPWVQTLKTRMGEILTVEQRGGKLTLTGSAVIVFEGCHENVDSTRCVST
jgi:diaminopimelate epimerase